MPTRYPADAARRDNLKHLHRGGRTTTGRPHYHGDLDTGTEIRLFDPRRKPQDWVDLMRPTDCAVFLKDRVTSAPIDENTCILFDRVAAAQRFCESRVAALPHLRCEIYDSQGLARPPLLVVVHPDVQRQEQAGSSWSRRRKVLAGVLALISVPLFWFGARSSSSSDVAIFLAINCVFVALRFVYWDVGTRHHEREKRKRLESHRKMERDDA